MSAQARSLLLLVSGYLPQPNDPGSSGDAHRRFGAQTCAHVLQGLRLAYNYSVEENLSDAPFGASEVAQLLPGLGNFAIEIMGFLENGEFLLDDLSTPSGDNDELAAPPKLKGGKKVETQSTTAPGTGSASSSATDEARRSRHEPALLPPHAPRRDAELSTSRQPELRGGQGLFPEGLFPEGSCGQGSTTAETDARDEDVNAGQRASKGDNKGRGRTKKEKTKGSGGQAVNRGSEQRKGPQDPEGDGGTGSAMGIRRYMSG